MPSSEYRKHKKFWENTRWGIESDLLAVIASQDIANRTHSKPLEPWRIKEMVTTKGFCQKLAALVIKPAAKIRQGFQMVAETLKGLANHG